ncbi:hypothetical protein GCM10017562_75130 [Streptomyces roseofulvus]|uniref:hypothetical protein n=1 Tax=Streptomyces roseofulvus TaxID=33902 RepID=UPI0031FD4569
MGERPVRTAGLDVLYRLGAQAPALALAGRPLADQARRLDALLTHTTWTADTLLAAHTAPFEGPVRISAGAVISARRTALPAAPTYVPSRTRRSAVPPRKRRTGG